MNNSRKNLWTEPTILSKIISNSNKKIKSNSLNISTKAMKKIWLFLYFQMKLSATSNKTLQPNSTISPSETKSSRLRWWKWHRNSTATRSAFSKLSERNIRIWVCISCLRIYRLKLQLGCFICIRKRCPFCCFSKEIAEQSVYQASCISWAKFVQFFSICTNLTLPTSFNLKIYSLREDCRSKYEDSEEAIEWQNGSTPKM